MDEVEVFAVLHSHLADFQLILLLLQLHLVFQLEIPPVQDQLDVPYPLSQRIIESLYDIGLFASMSRLGLWDDVLLIR
jgi:hypothetical protein